MDTISSNVVDMYAKYPYPFPNSKTKNVNELLNLFRFFSIENNFDFDGKKILDAGTGTGHRIINVAKHYKKSEFLAIDFSKNSINVAQELMRKNKITNIKFEVVNLLNKIHSKEKFDVVLSMGVLHHLSNPEKGLKNILNVLKNDGVLFLYLYGKLGGHDRMIKKKIISLLLKNKKNYQEGITLVKKLKFDNFEYGWNIESKNNIEKDSVIVDAYLHANEKLYDFNDIDYLLKNSGLYGYSIFGITTKTKGLLFSTNTNQKIKTAFTDISKSFSSKITLDYYNSLNIKTNVELLNYSLNLMVIQ